MRIIGIHGKARSGKDELSKVLKDTYGFVQISFAKKLKDIVTKYFEIDENDVEEFKTAFSRQILQATGLSVREQLLRVYQAQGGEFSDKEKTVSGFPKWVEDIAVAYYNLDYTNVKSKRKEVLLILNGIHTMWVELLDEFMNVSDEVGENIWINYAFRSIQQDRVHIISDVRFLNEKNYIENVALGKTVKIERTGKPSIGKKENEHVSETALDNVTDWYFEIENPHKSDWRLDLERQGINLVRKLDNENFFTEQDKKYFKVKIDEHN